MRSILLAAVMAMTLVPAVRPQPAPAALDPAGKWSFSTHDEDGTALTGTMEITGQPGSYHGAITVTGMDDKLPITDVAVSSNLVIVLANTQEGTPAIVKIWKGTDGKLQAFWSPVKQVFPAVVEKVQ
jgi:hypothetical protein